MMSLPSRPEPGAAVLRLSLAVALAATLLLTATTVPAAGADGVINRGPDTHRTIALTFDDGYAPQRCLEIADILSEHGVPATWFPNGAYVVASPKVWRKIASRFPIANHTYRHPSLVGMKAKEIRAELERNERAIERVTGRPMSRILRPTFGAYDDRVLRVAGELGYRVVNWDVSSADTSPRGTDRGIAKRALSGGPGSIILMHCGPEVTPRILPIVIARYACDGYRFATLEDLLAGRRGSAADVTCPPPALPARGGQAQAKPDNGYGPEAPAQDASEDEQGPLARFLQQTPRWETCKPGLECTRVRVPRDHDAPDDGREAVRIYRIAAGGPPQGTLIVGPAGPDTAADEFLARVAAAAGESLLEHDDVLAFDPRRGRDGGAVSGDDLARDLELVRRVLDIETIDYYGSGSGAAIGARYAAMFPQHVGSLVLDGPPRDPQLMTPPTVELAASGDGAGDARGSALLITHAGAEVDAAGWAEALGASVDSAAVITIGEAGSEPGYLSDPCLAAAVDRYLIDGTLPGSELACVDAVTAQLGGAAAGS